MVQELCKFIIFLHQSLHYAIIIYNTVACWNRPWSYCRNRRNALQINRKFCAMVIECLWQTIIKYSKWCATIRIRKHMRKDEYMPDRHHKNRYVALETLRKICIAPDRSSEDFGEITPKQLNGLLYTRGVE